MLCGIAQQCSHLPVREVAFGSEANGVDKVLGVCSSAVFCLHIPPECLFTELSTYDPRLESYVFLDIKLAFNVCKVLPQFIVAGVLLGPSPILPSCQRHASTTIVLNIGMSKLPSKSLEANTHRLGPEYRLWLLGSSSNARCRQALSQPHRSCI